MWHWTLPLRLPVVVVLDYYSSPPTSITTATTLTTATPPPPPPPPPQLLLLLLLILLLLTSTTGLGWEGLGVYGLGFRATTTTRTGAVFHSKTMVIIAASSINLASTRTMMSDLGVCCHRLDSMSSMSSHAGMSWSI